MSSLPQSSLVARIPAFVMSLSPASLNLQVGTRAVNTPHCKCRADRSNNFKNSFKYSHVYGNVGIFLYSYEKNNICHFESVTEIFICMCYLPTEITSLLMVKYFLLLIFLQVTVNVFLSTFIQDTFSQYKYLPTIFLCSSSRDSYSQNSKSSSIYCHNLRDNKLENTSL